MKIFKSAILVLTIFVAFFSCQKELVFDNNGVSAGTFKKDAGGDCLPVTVTGIFKVDTVLTNTLFVDVQVNATTPGTFDIKSDTINGFSFSRAGTVVFGTNTIRLYASGKPIAAGNNTFTVKYGTSTCTFNITVVGTGSGAAVFTLGSTGGICTGATPAGTFTVGVPLTPANTLTVTVTVTTPGTYSIGAVTGIGGGFIFTGTGVFNNTGTQNVTLTGSGTPITAGVQTVTVVNVALSTCTYAVTVLAAGGGGTAAAFTLDGAPNTCSAFTVNGTYTVNSAVTVSNTVVLKVTVQTAGTYSITTNSANGISFAAAGTLALGAQTITLTATGTPTAAVTSVFKPNIATTCDFSITAVAAPPLPNTDYFPLTNNSWWSYNIVGNLPADTAYNLIYGTKAYNGNTYTEMQENYQAIPQDTAHYRKVGNDYIQYAPTDYYSGFLSFDSPPVYDVITFLKENATTGTTWTTGPFNGTVNVGTPNDPASVKYTFTIASPSTSITVNSVNYTNVIHVTVAVKFTVPSQGVTDGVTENDDYYYAKGIGLIKIIYTPTALIGGGAAYVVDIKNYKVF